MRLACATEVAITVDDIPTHEDDYDWMSRRQALQGIIAHLHQAGAPSVYGFVNGTGGDGDHPPAVDSLIYRDWLDAGFRLGNHTYYHHDFSKTSLREFIGDIRQTDLLLARQAADRPLAERRTFRYPFLNEGNTLAKREGLRDYFARHGYRVAEVTIDFSDWRWNQAYIRCREQKNTSAQAWLVEHVVDQARAELARSVKLADRLYGREIKHILLLHQAGMHTFALGAILQAYQKDGVNFISLEEALADPVYAVDHRQAAFNMGNFLEETAAARGMDSDVGIDPPYADERIDSVCVPPAHARK